jgi:hypothetical protein
MLLVFGFRIGAGIIILSGSVLVDSHGAYEEAAVWQEDTWPTTPTPNPNGAGCLPIQRRGPHRRAAI